jgi:hypothetical protein
MRRPSGLNGDGDMVSGSGRTGSGGRHPACGVTCEEHELVRGGAHEHHELLPELPRLMVSKRVRISAEPTYDVPPRNSAMIASRSFWGISPCIDETVKSAVHIFSVNQSTCKELVKRRGLLTSTYLTHLASCVTEDHCLGNGEGVI